MKVVFVERRDPETSSLERVFRVISRVLSGWGVEVEHRKLPFGNSFRGMVANAFSRMPRVADVYHVTGQIHYYALFLPRDRTLLTIHDLNVLNNRQGFRRFVIQLLFYNLPIKRSKYITVVSEQIRQELITAIHCREDKIITINNPVTVVSRRHEKPFERRCPTILHIGTAPHKNLANLIRAIAGIDCSLRIIGPLDSPTMGLLKENAIIFQQRMEITDEELLDEYDEADIVSFCSLYEGFGLPIIEAQALSIPLITSDRSPMRDVAGDGAVLVNPESPKSIRQGILEIINNDRMRADVVSRGNKNVKRFSPEAIAGQYCDIYNRIAESNSKPVKRERNASHQPPYVS